MSRPITRNPTEETKDKQRLATRPDLFAWILANAGSGKTTVLVRRILRLLLAGVEPPQILCLTYTDAAASNMKNRLLKDLSSWAVMPEDKLAGALRDLMNEEPSRRVLARARELFAVALQSPGGLKIGTIHGFCTRILQVAPIEANVPARFEVLDEASANVLLAEALKEVLVSSDTDPALSTAIGAVAEEFGTQSRILELVGTALAQRALLLDTAGNPIAADLYRDQLSKVLGLAAGESADQHRLSFLTRVPDAQTLAAWRQFLIGRTQRADINVCEALGRILVETRPAELFRLWCDILLSAADTPKRDQDFLIKATALEAPGIREALIALAPFAAEANERVKAIEIRDRSSAIHQVVGAVLAAYAARKLARRKLDFADLIAETKSLVKRVEASWLLYKLDAEIEHLLVDEAQDTNQDQWEILQELTAEFVAGAGVRAGGKRPRTVFAVGDQKQSIFSFQGADPQAFEDSRRHYRKKTAEAGMAFSSIELNQSFRSTKAVMALVDAVFRTPERWRGLSHEPGIAPQKHISARGGDLGCVDLWPLEPKAKTVSGKGWEEMPEQAGNPTVALATRLARMLASWTEAGVDDQGRPFSPGDVLILLRNRNTLYREIIRALLMAQVPVAGMDRLDLMQHLAVQDMVVIGEALLLPDDDLALATCLKTPIFGLDDNDLMRLTQPPVSGLWAALQASTEPKLGEAARRFARLMGRARSLGPFAFYADLLGPGGGYRAMVARLGNEAGDALNAWLSAALKFDRQNGPSLAGFLAEMRLSQASVKRDLAEAQGEVRVMTVHGAKGLEAPVVILPDVGILRAQKLGFRVLHHAEAGQSRRVLVWMRTKEQDIPLTGEAYAGEKARSEEEHNRLLYVALTRAEDRLIVAGVDDKHRSASSWYTRVEAGVADLGDLFQPVPMPDGSGTMLRMSSGELPKALQPTGAQRPAAPAVLEPWLTRPARREFQPEPPLTPSTLVAAADEAMPQDLPPVAMEAGGFGPRERGQIVHLLLQHLHLVDPADRAESGRRLARQIAPQLDASWLERLLDDTLALMAHPEVAPLFGPQGLSEVAVAGRIQLGSGAMRDADGRIDRLLVLPDALVFADFKTTPSIPEGADQVPASVLRQMAVYHALLEQAFPGRVVRARLVYTAGPAVIPLGPEQLVAARSLIEKRSNMRDVPAPTA